MDNQEQYHLPFYGINKKIMRLNICFAFTVSFLLLSCSSSKQFVYNYVNFDYNQNMKIVLNVPKKYKVFKINEKELKLTYKDSCVIFFSYDKLGGTVTNGKNRFNEGIGIIYRENYNDSIFLEGIDKENLYWKEYFLDDVIIGYINVPFSKKNEFDKAIESAMRKRN